MIERVNCAIFVSQALADRVIEESPLVSSKIHVSMNATEGDFLSEFVEAVSPPHPYEELRRPILGIVGVVNEQLDFELLLACADLPLVGTLLFVGPCQFSIFPLL